MKLNTKVHWQPKNEKKRNKIIQKSGLYEDEGATLTRGLEGGNK